MTDESIARKPLPHQPAQPTDAGAQPIDPGSAGPKRVQKQVGQDLHDPQDKKLDDT